MSNGLQKVAGSRIYIGGQVDYKSEVEASDFSGLTWVEVDGWSTSGDLGAEQETITQTLINRNITLYSKGVISFPIMSNMFVPMPEDPGQIAMLAAQESCKPYAFRIVWGADCGEESVVTISIAEPGVVSWVGHGLPAGTPIMFATTGALPTGLTAGTTYYVLAPATDSFTLAATPGGAAITTSGSQSGVHTAFAEAIGETDLLFGFAMFGVKSGGDSSATRMLSLPIQPIAKAITV